ncbi:MAG: hypothetical protein H5T83_13085 [Actinotalea sp.]|nr:hypothetical protein [Actinotalea sp.]
MATHAPEDPDARPGLRRRTSFGAVLLAFLLGVALTGLVTVVLLGVGIATVGDAQEALGASPSPSPTPTEAPRSTGGTASGSVPQACVESAEYNQVFTEALDEIAVGIRDQDARTVQEALSAVQSATPGSEASSQECLDLAEQDASGGADDAADDATDDTDDTDDDATDDSPEETPTSTPTP